MQSLPATSPVRTTIMAAVSEGIIVYCSSMNSLLGLPNTRVSDVMNVHRNTVGKAKNGEGTRDFSELLLPLIHRDKMQQKQPLLVAYFKTIGDDPESTKSGTLIQFLCSDSLFRANPSCFFRFTKEML